MAEPQQIGQALTAHNEVEVIEHDAGGHGGDHVGPVAFGFVGPAAWVSLAMLIFIAILLWKGVHKLIARGLDSKIIAIREQLDEAKALRAEAEALRSDYAARIADAENDAAAMLQSARAEAAAIVEKAEFDSANVIARRERMAQDRIAAAERGAIDEVRARAAAAATEASGRIIAERHHPDADRRLVDEAIANL